MTNPPLLTQKKGRLLTKTNIMEFLKEPHVKLHLRGDDFKSTVYTGRSIKDSIIGSCVYKDCVLKKWTFRETCFSRVGFLNTSLERLKLYKVSGRGVFFVKCRVDNALFEETLFVEGSMMGTIFHNCYFTKTKFSKCDLRGAVFSKCTFVENVEFHGCDLAGTQFYKGTYYSQKGDAVKAVESSGDCVFYTETGSIPEAVNISGEPLELGADEFENCSMLAESWVNSLDIPDVYKICAAKPDLGTKPYGKTSAPVIYRQPVSSRPTNRAVLYGTFVVENE